MRRHLALCLLSAAGLLAAAPALAAPPSEERPAYAATVFAGSLIDNTWEEAPLFWDWDFQSSHLVGAAAAARLARPLPGLSLEAEAQLVRHFGDQDHWEVNAPVLTARWLAFPWSATLDTSAAFGLGLSLASETPQTEVALEGSSEALLAYWMVELDAGLPDSAWRVTGRLHHRSTAFGTFGDDGGSNALVLGVKRLF
jgi:hypothetical protein